MNKKKMDEGGVDSFQKKFIDFPIANFYAFM